MNLFRTLVMIIGAMLSVAPLTVDADSYSAATQKPAVRVGFSERQGRRHEQEDRVVIADGIYAVLDGHGGEQTSERASVLLPLLNQKYASLHPRDRWVAIINDLELQLRQEGVGRSGSTLIGVIIENGVATIANLGDARAIVIHNGVVVTATQDHKPSNPEEIQRIKAAGGWVANVYGVARVAGRLAVARALGDFELKAPANGQRSDWVCYKPDIYERQLRKGARLVLACDGLWDTVGNEEVAKFVLDNQAIDGSKISVKNQSGALVEQFKEVGFKDLLGVAQGLRDLSYNRGSGDNISVMVIEYQAPEYKYDYEQVRATE